MKKTIVSLAAAVALTGCPKPEEAEGDIKIGVIISLTGNYGALGSERLQGVELAFEEINKAGGVLGGRKLIVHHRDDGTVGTNARAIAEEMVTVDKVPAIIGASASGSTIPVSEITIANKIPQISGSSTSPVISGLDDQGYVNRTCPSDALQGKLLAQRAYAKGITRAAALYADNPYGKGLADSFVAAFQALGGQITASKAITENKTSYVTELTEIYSPTLPPQAIVMPLYTFEATQVIKDYNSTFQAKGTFWLFPDSVADSAFVDGVGGQSGFTFQHEGTGPGTPQGASAAAFIAAYDAKYGGEPESTSFAINFYDAGYLLALAIEAAGSLDGAAIKDQLALVSKGGTAYTPTQFRAAATAAAGGEDVNYEGASGPVDLDAKGDPVAPYDIWKVQDGKVTIVEPAVGP